MKKNDIENEYYLIYETADSRGGSQRFEGGIFGIKTAKHYAERLNKLGFGVLIFNKKNNNLIKQYCGSLPKYLKVK